MKISRQMKREASLGLGQARALLYSLESLPLPWLHDLISDEERQLPSQQQQVQAMLKGRELLKRDAQDFAELDLPLEWLVSLQPLTHFGRWAAIMGDSTLSFWRRRNKQTQAFSKKVKNLEDFPDYYRRNFHHQTDGYLSVESAQIYEHQVELLFRGLADPMRRRLLKPMLQRFKNKKNIKILELGCGSGTFTRFLAEALPNAKITAVDLSPSYIQYARSRMTDLSHVDFLVGDASDLLFKDQSFDAVFSVFLHHELPEKVRKKVISESFRVCKAEGYWAILDSIQLGDDPELDWAIKQFPKNFHEPFFTNYIKKPLRELAREQSPSKTFEESVHFLSKIISSG